ncbi:MAG: hypothetical protein HYW01_08940 [Deltaproteobacteria bacterium]|nr:hypothetical protein [Deltaproteobacteria bacterium]
MRIKRFTVIFVSAFLTFSPLLYKEAQTEERDDIKKDMQELRQQMENMQKKLEELEEKNRILEEESKKQKEENKELCRV